MVKFGIIQNQDENFIYSSSFINGWMPTIFVEEDTGSAQRPRGILH